VGIFGRSLDDLLRLTEETLDVPRDPLPFPTKILYPVDFFPLPDPIHQELVEQFVAVLERYLDTKRTEVNLAAEWSKSAPAGVQRQGLQEYMAKVRLHVFGGSYSETT
jgi:hypothetical protein